MASFKRLKRSDVISVPYVANKNWVFNYCPYPIGDEYIKILKGTNVTGSFSLDSDPVTEGQYERLIYSQINHLFYQNFTSSLNTSSLATSLYYESQSTNRLTGSYFDYNENSSLIKNFPTESNAGIRVLSISKNLYGQQIQPYQFELSSSAYYIKDDGIGNLIDLKNSSSFVGNIFYSHGISVITNPDYQSMFPLPPLSKNILLSFPTTSSSKDINLMSYVDGRGGQILTGSIILSNSSSFSISGSGFIICNESSSGTFTTLYTVSSSFTGSTSCSGSRLVSNQSTITVNLFTPAYIPPTPTPTATPSPTPTPTLPPLSIPSNPSGIVSSCIVDTIPNPPTNLSFSFRDNTSLIRITWTQPLTSLPTNGYIFGYRKIGTEDTFIEKNIHNIIYNITGINSGEKYEGYVQSYNGYSLLSEKLTWSITVP